MASTPTRTPIPDTCLKHPTLATHPRPHSTDARRHQIPTSSSRAAHAHNAPTPAKHPRPQAPKYPSSAIEHLHAGKASRLQAMTPTRHPLRTPKMEKFHDGQKP
ncbi:hypothetical protein K438DRAFT_687931 [Mycena galopus ATCC 62051]|nr:hypothetical protein K438DRAFT_687931 [Mycena galopus ATCC 62051]